ncbi:hypothetical protein FB45DRAFT_954092 [Roridomyces roridus]|uniref:Uncharacterized protein n=1 Tax=Roridomyces roridus TaxID=1738132 RepID=A0AAD7F6K6_9AGAR|nr:hypothetical protein FB45DRAFT_954092 [Roridomyces roridus]
MAGRLTPYPHHDNMNMPLSYGGGFKPERALNSQYRDSTSRRMSRRSISSGFPSGAAHSAVQRQYSTSAAVPGGMVRNASLAGLGGFPGGHGEHHIPRAARTPQNSPFLGRAQPLGIQIQPQYRGTSPSPLAARSPVSPRMPMTNVSPRSPHLPPLPPISPRPVSPGHPQGSYGRRSPGYGQDLGYQDPYSPTSSYAQARSPSPYSYTAYGHGSGHHHGHGHHHRHHRSRSRPSSAANVNYTSVPHQSQYGSHYTRTQHVPYVHGHTSHVGVVRRQHHHGSGSREAAFVVEPSDSGSEASSHYSGGYDSDSFYSGSDGGESFYSDDEYEYDSGGWSDDDGYYSDD